MSMNAHHCCIVFSNNEMKARNKLEEIAAGGHCTDKRLERGSARYIVDSDEWIWLRPNETAMGRRAHKAWVDENCTIKEYFYIIQPLCYLYCDDIKFF